jgi:hypothetical protein
MTDRVEDFIAHYASEFYDPAKAHEYYERNKELKGRKSTKGMSDVQKEALSYTKSKIGAAKKADLAKAQANQKAKLEAIRKTAEASRARIAAKLKGLLDKIAAQANIIPKPVVKPTPLNVIPPNASPRLRAYLEKQNTTISQNNKKALDKANSEYMAKRQAAQQVASESSNAARKAAGEEMKKVGAEAKNAIAKARSAYTASRKQVVDKYEKATDAEFQNIRTQLPSAPPPVKKPRTSTGRKRRTTKKEGDLQNDSETRL